MAIVAQFAGSVTAILLAWLTSLGYWALVAQTWASASVSLILLWLTCPWRPSLARNWRTIGPAVRFGAHLTGFGIVNYFHRQFDNVLIGWRWGSADLGFYTRAYALLTLPFIFHKRPDRFCCRAGAEPSAA